MKGIIITGGTGGHIFPAIAVGREFEKNGAKITYFIVGNKLKNLKLPEMQTRRFKAGSPLSGNILKRVANSFKLTRLFLKGLLIIHKDTDFVLGSGSYASFSLVAAAKFKRIKTYMLEQNSVPGVVTRYFSQKETKTFISFPMSTKFLKGEAKLVGNPIRYEAKIKIPKEDARNILGIRRQGKIILVMGGSLGALHFSQSILEFASSFEDLFFVIQTGRHFKILSSMFGERSDNHFLISFHEKPGILYSAADYIISRAGAGSIYELSYHAKPSLFVPYPYAKDDHQLYNANYIQDNNAGILLKENELNGEKFAEAINKLEKQGDELAKNLYNLFPKDAERTIYKEIIDDFR